jgi:uncharacterized membrane protein
VARGHPRARHRATARLDLEALVGGILAAGLLTSVALIVAGLAWRWALAGTLRMDYALPGTNVARFLFADVHHAPALATGPRRLVSLGIGVLMLTPYLRVLASLLYFVLVARSRTYATITAIVLATLTYSLFS